MNDRQGPRFDPFIDRRARLIRNGLSTAFIEAVREGNFGRLKHIAGQLEAEHHDTLYRGYIEARVARYEEVFSLCLNLGQQCDVFELAALLWQYGLFFEVHEVLEEVWGKAAGKRRKALQGLIQAAGYFLLLEAGNVSGAERLADKAAANLAANRKQLPEYLRIEDLIEKLLQKDPCPSPLVLSLQTEKTPGKEKLDQTGDDGHNLRKCFNSV